DTATDFIRPEFLNILFFQQKNLVIFPYVDLKHLHGLEAFTIGYTTIDLESTALHSLREFLEVEVNNCYSQTPNLFFIYNVDKEKLQEIMKLKDIRCIINTNEDVKELANGSSFIFFNKKNNQFLNYNKHDSELKFETYLVANSENEIILQDKIQLIKSAATRIFTELNKDSELKNLSEILKNYNRQYWNDILSFTENYYNITVPRISDHTFPKRPRRDLEDYSHEYEIIVSTNRVLAKEFIQFLHEYRSKKVNPANLELEELFNPQKLYNYLRNHHWKKGIPQEFIDEWIQMNISQYILTDSDKLDYKNILDKLGLKNKLVFVESLSKDVNTEPEIKNKKTVEKPNAIPSIQYNWEQYRTWISKCIGNVEHILDNDLTIYSSSDITDIMQELLEIRYLLGIEEDPSLILENHRLNIQKISNPKIKGFYNTAEMLFHNFKNSGEINDASGILLYYTKVFETILHEKVSSYLRSLVKKYKKPYYRRETSQEFNNTFGHLMNGESIVLGQWVRIIENLYQSQQDPILQEFYDYIKINFDKNTFTIIKKACEYIKPLRNPITHTESLSMDKLIPIRKKIFNVLNPIIRKLY
ncbi:MAG: hypothetical protein ACFFHD_14205, partial [Promethearchaeota archaeon]